MEYYGKIKPEAVITHEDFYDVHLKGDSTHHHFATEAEALAFAKEYEAKATAEWEERNSAETKRREKERRFYHAMQSMVEMLKKDSANATRMGDHARSDAFKHISARIRGEMKDEED